ncbi:MAG: heme lyase CcmF/NrfE family subunit, partial [Kiloniellales bacterium]
GWWFWDPVENASFMPWLVGTALLHSAIVVEKRDSLKSWTILLAILAFSLSLIGTFLVRSGVLTSVHTFATDPGRGVFILALLVIAIGGSLVLYAVRAPALKPGGLFAPISREGALILNNLLLTTACATVFLGTLYPLFIDALGGDKLSVGAPYFNATFVPLMVPLIALMAVGPMLTWKRGDLMAVLARLKVALVAAVVIALGTLYLGRGGPVLAVPVMGLAAWLMVGAIIELAERVKLFRLPLALSLRRARGLPRAAWATALAHAGVAVVLAGITGVTAWERESILVMKPGDSTQIAGYDVTLERVRRIEGPNYSASQGTFTVLKDGARFTTLMPEKRFYPVQGTTTTEAAIRTTGLADLYVVLGDANEAGGWTVRLYHKPFVPWIWFGASLMMLGGLISLTDRRFRVGAPARRPGRAAKAAVQPAE